MLLLAQANVTRRVELWVDLGWEPQGSGGRAVPRRMDIYKAFGVHCGKVHCSFLI